MPPTTSFPLTLGADPFAGLDAEAQKADEARRAKSQALIDSLQAQRDALTGKSMLSPEQQTANQYENDKNYKLGLLAMVGGGEGMQQLGGTMFKNALAQRTPQVTEHGIANPLTGQWSYSPEYQGQRLDTQLFQARQHQADEDARAAAQGQQRREAFVFKNALLQNQGLGPGADLNPMVDAIGTYQTPEATVLSRANPATKAAILQQVKAKYPGYDPTFFHNRQAAGTAFTSGPLGNQMRGFAVAGQHLDQLGTLVDALGNGDLPAVNKIANIYATQTGNPAPTNFDAAKGIIAKEVISAIVAGGGGQAEREDIERQISSQKTPQQLKGTIAQMRSLMQAKHDALLAQRRAAGLPDETMPKYGEAGGAAPAAAGWSAVRE